MSPRVDTQDVLDRIRYGKKILNAYKSVLSNIDDDDFWIIFDKYTRWDKNTYGWAANRAEVVIKEDGDYLIHARVSCRIITFTDDSMMQGWMYVNGNIVPGALFYIFMGTHTGVGFGTASTFTVRTMKAGERVGIVVKRVSGTSQLRLTPNGSTLYIERLDAPWMRERDVS